MDTNQNAAPIVSPAAETLALTLDSATSAQIADAIVIRRTMLPPWLDEAQREAVRSDLWKAATALTSAARRLDAAARKLAKAGGAK